jgi:hypothetical protein
MPSRRPSFAPFKCRLAATQRTTRHHLGHRALPP